MTMFFTFEKIWTKTTTLQGRVMQFTQKKNKQVWFGYIFQISTNLL